jgi:hypothetical protein
LVHVLRIVPSAAIVIDAMPLVSVAVTAILTLKKPLYVAPFAGELMLTAGGLARGGGGGGGGGGPVFDPAVKTSVETLYAGMVY